MSDVQITQLELQEVFELEREISERQERADHLKENLKALLMEKMPIEPGRFYARLVWRTVHHPAWKEAVVEHLGASFAEEFRKASSSNRISEVLVEEHAVEPLWKGLEPGAESEN
jgi:hypothetical protein